MRKVRPLAAAAGAAAFVAAVFAFARAGRAWAEYRALLPSDLSGAEVYLDEAEIAGAAGIAALGLAAGCGFAARRG
ncbi:MAG TPA: hypothetical protein VG777_04140 [Thermoanaerobaculia bacterium]|nr:hypothetical protein [Thermoanaerobaculia bacterium]